MAKWRKSRASLEAAGYRHWEIILAISILAHKNAGKDGIQNMQSRPSTQFIDKSSCVEKWNATIIEDEYILGYQNTDNGQQLGKVTKLQRSFFKSWSANSG